eukprot:TRINITY_DN22922_c0_g2_i1.p1 TRINITY_DN22922_c0_g2~~TRINITY_DN22922_c0_g2_i1.p1  ORF type:complete len:591 (-),score=110.94 TRINITY_DN22922_c0_g2_i1:547-2163(-)
MERSNINYPVLLNHLKDTVIICVASGYAHSLALSSEGVLYSWGLNDSGQLGLGNRESSSTPLIVKGMKNVSSVACGRNHTLVVTKDGQLYAWGGNKFGQLGIGNNVNQLSPQKVNIHDITSISCGENYSLALSSDGKVYAWGHNLFGQLGIGNKENQDLPTLLELSKRIVAISTGRSHSMALTANGILYSWGLNNCGQLGNGNNDNQSLPQIIKIPNIFSICSSGFHSMAISTDHTLYTWGCNQFGQLGIGLSSNQHTPKVSSQLKDYPLFWFYSTQGQTSKIKATPSLPVMVNEKDFSDRLVFDLAVEYKGIINLLQHFTPNQSCKAYVEDLSKGNDCQMFSVILSQVEKWIKSQNSGHFPSYLDENEILAIALYTWDIRFCGTPENNFYYILNNILRKRSSSEVLKWSGYLYYFQKALSKLPNFSGTVFRGVINPEMLRTHYTLGRKIHWSAFSSTTTTKKTAIGFATKDSNTGVLMKMKIKNGKSISGFSGFGEDEILLSPNMGFFVSSELELRKEQKYYLLELVEESHDDLFIF